MPASIPQHVMLPILLIDIVGYTAKYRNQVLVQYKEDVKSPLPLELRLVLAYGNVQMAADQLAGDVMSEAKRLIDDKNFKKYQELLKKPTSLLVSALFYQSLQEELKSKANEFPDLAALPWQRVEIKDKHKHNYIGYLQGNETLEAVLGKDKTAKSAATKPRPIAIPAADPGGYLQYLFEDTGYIDIRGLQVSVGKACQFPISELYIQIS
jgi:hypothetical protein